MVLEFLSFLVGVRGWISQGRLCVCVKVWAQERLEDISVKLIFIKISFLSVSPFVLLMGAVADIVHT